MKKILLASLLLIGQTSFAQDCNTQAQNKPFTFVRSQDNYEDEKGFNVQKPRSWNITKMKSQLDKAEAWIKNRLTGFTGAKLNYYNDYFFNPHDFVTTPSKTYQSSFAEDFYKATGIKGYYWGKMMFFAYYCYNNKLPMHTEGESGSSIRVIFNNVFASGLCEDIDVFTINGKFAFKKYEKSHSEGRIDFYDLRAKNGNDSIYISYKDIIIIRNSDKPVFIPITRKEYLEQMLKDIQIFKVTKKDYLNSSYVTRVKEFEKEMGVYKTSDKSYTPEKEAKRRQWFNEDNNPEKLAKALKKLEDEVKNSTQIIMEYLGKPAEWLSRGFSAFYNGSYESYYPPGLKDFFDRLDVFTESKGDYTRKEVVYINPAYFNKELKSDMPQLISVVLAKSKYPHMLKVARLVKQPGALAPLEAILNPGNSAPPEPVVPEVMSTYTLKYLPKLTNLTPLIVPPGMKLSVVPVTNNNTPAPKFNFETPAFSPKLNQLPQLLTTDNYKTYIQQLYTSISNGIKPGEKTKADDYIKNKKLTQSKDISNTAFAAWLQNAPATSLYIYSKAVMANPLDALAANNFSAFLIMGGLPEKSIPILEFWNQQKPGEATLLGNLGNAYYRLGDMDKAMRYLQQCVRYDTLHPTANKILCLMYLKKGDTKKAEEHGTKSITTSYDEQVIKILRNLNNKVKPGEIMSRLPAKEFPLLKRTGLLAMPSNLDEMEEFAIDFKAERESLNKTIDDITAKMPRESDDMQQKIMKAGLTKGFSLIQAKAQQIIMDGAQVYHSEMIREYDVFKYNLKILVAPYNVKVKAITKKYGDQLNKLEGGEAGDEDQIAALELAKCKEINAEKAKYLAGLSALVNGYAQRIEFISRKFYRDYANWAPYWILRSGMDFPSIEASYLKDVYNILGEYNIVEKENCSVFEPLGKKEGKLKEWEDEYCANFKGKLGMGPVKVFVTCNSWGIEGGEGIVGEFEMKYKDDGAFEDFTLGAGLGVNWHLGKEEIIKMEIGVSGKEFIKVGPDKATGKWILKDVGVKAEITGEASIGKVAVEEKVLEISIAVNAGFEAGGILSPILGLK